MKFIQKVGPGPAWGLDQLWSVGKGCVPLNALCNFWGELRHPKPPCRTCFADARPNSLPRTRACWKLNENTARQKTLNICPWNYLSLFDRPRTIKRRPWNWTDYPVIHLSCTVVPAKRCTHMQNDSAHRENQVCEIWGYQGQCQRGLGSLQALGNLPRYFGSIPRVLKRLNTNLTLGPRTLESLPRALKRYSRAAGRVPRPLRPHPRALKCLSRSLSEGLRELSRKLSDRTLSEALGRLLRAVGALLKGFRVCNWQWLCQLAILLCHKGSE